MQTRNLALVLGMGLILLEAGCGLIPLPPLRSVSNLPGISAATPNPLVQNTNVPETETPTPVLGETPSPTFTLTRRSATVPPTAKPILITIATVAPGNPSGNPASVFATDIRLDPPRPTSGPYPVTFYVTFNNASGKTQALKWIVKIWSPENTVHSFGQTSAQMNDIPPGLSEIASAANWQTNPIFCAPFYARVYWINTDITADPIEFKKPNGAPGPLTNFQVCP